MKLFPFGSKPEDGLTSWSSRGSYLENNSAIFRMSAVSSARFSIPLSPLLKDENFGPKMTSNEKQKLLNPQCSMKPIPFPAKKLPAPQQQIDVLRLRFALTVFLSTWVCAALSAAGADKPLVVEVWPGKVPDENGGIGAERFRMSPALERKQVEVTEPTQMITDVTKPTITIYRPAKDQDTGTAILICPGGGYWNLYWQLEGEEVAAWLNSIGVNGIILKYRVPRRPDEPKGEPARRPLQDAQRAVSLVRSKAGEWGINPQRIGITGFSAGGHLAIATATTFDKRTYEPIDDIDKISCRPDFAIPVYSGYLKAKDKDELAPGLRVPTGTPPVFLVHGSDDIVSPPQNSVLMYLALKQADVPAELHIYAATTHDFGVRTSDRPYASWTESCAKWLRDQGFLKPPVRP